MKDVDKGTGHLIDELERLRLRIKQLEAAKTGREEAANRLIDSEIRYRSLFETAQDGILILDAKTGQVTDVNPFLEIMLGYSHEEFVGKKIWEIGPFKDVKESKVVFRELQEKGYVRYEHLPLQTKDGRDIAVEFVSNVYKINHTSVIQCNIRDITERKRIEERLEKERQEFGLIVDSSPIIIFYKDKDGKVLLVNKTFAEALGIPQEKFLGKTVFDFYSAEIAQAMADDDQEVLKSGRPKLNIIEQYESTSGIRWVKTDKIPIFDENGLPTGLVGFAQDVTEWRKTQEYLLESEAKYRDIAGSITDVFFALDENLRYTYWNKASEELTGISAKEALGKSVYDIFPDDESTGRAVNAYRRALATKEPQHLVNEYSLSGRDYVFDISAYPTREGLCVYVKDITERRKLEKALEESEQWYRLIFDNTPIGIGFASLDGKVITINKAMESITGYSAEDFHGINIIDMYVDKADREALLKELRQHGSVVDYPVRLRRKDNTQYDALLTSKLTSIGDKKFVQTISYDITERKKAEEALKESEERYRSLVELSPEAIFVASEGKHVFINSAGLKLFGASSPEQVIGKQVMDMIHPDYREIVATRIEESIKKGMAPPTLEEKFLRLDGTEIDVEVRAAPLIYQGRPAMQAVVRGISERKQAEEALRLSEQNFRDSIESSPLGIRIIDEDGKTLYANRASLDIYGYSSLKELEAVPRKRRYTTQSYAEHLERVKKRKRGEYVTDNYEISIVRKDGQVRDLTVSRREVMWNGEQQFQMVYQDITERKQAEEQYRTIIHGAMDGFWQADMEGRFIDVNDAYCQLIGYGRDELMNRTIADVEVIENAKEIAKHMQKIKKIGYDRFESRHRRKDGKIVDVDVSVNYLPVYGGRMFTFIRDVTQRKRAEHFLQIQRDLAFALRSTHGIDATLQLCLYAAIQASALDCGGIYIVDEATGNLDLICHRNLSPGFIESVSHYGPDSGNARLVMQGKPVYTQHLDLNIFLTNAEKAEKLRAISVIPVSFNNRVVGCLNVSSHTLHEIPDFAQRVLETMSTQIGEAIALAKAEEKRKQAEAEMRTKDYAMASSISGILLLNLDGVVLYANRAYLDMWAYQNAEEAVGHNITEIAADKELAQMLLTTARTTGEWKGELHATLKEGRIIDVLLSVSLVRDENGVPIAIMASTIDITERKRVEEALQESEAHYRLLAENVRDVIWAMDMDLRFTYVSPSIKYLGDRIAEEVMSMSLGQLLTPSSRELAMKTFTEEQAIANVTAQDPTRSRTLEVEFIRRDGSILWAELKMNFMYGPDNRPVGILGVMRDVSERKQAEEERREFEQKAQLASRLASVGELASGVAHEINNPLTGVIGYSELLMQEDVPERIKNDLEIINNGAKRVADIVKGLLKFARQTKPERTLVNINEIINVTLRLRAYELETSNIKVTARLAPDLPLTIADAGQIQQVFLNLLINAEMEMRLAHGKGKLIVNTEHIDKSIRISFKDNGPGIAKENLERIFDPFFTTREVGEGTGLGLSICHGIVTEHSGRIWAESRLGSGATFIVELPIITREKRPRHLKTAVKPQKVIKGKILVVDDEPVVRQLLTEVLTAEGHEVDTTADGKDALNRIKDNGYSLILVDMKLPGMSGGELYERIQGIAESLAQRVVFITGDVMAVDTEAFLTRTGVPFIAKPFNVKQIKAEIRRLLATSGPTRTAKSNNHSQKLKAKI